MATGSDPQGAGEYITGEVVSRVERAGMSLTGNAVARVQSIAEDGVRRDPAEAVRHAGDLADRIAAGATQVAGLRSGDVMDGTTIDAIKRWFCPWHPWC